VTSRCAVGEVNPELFDDVGRFTARADVLFREWRVIVEYDGEQHRSTTGSTRSTSIASNG